MDLQAHYGKIRQEEHKLEDEFPLISSHETADGGRAGVVSEVTRRIAARFIALGLARIATGEEKKIYRDAQAEARRTAEDALDMARQTTAALLSRGFERLQSSVRPKE